MVKRLHKKFNVLYDKRISGKGLAIFRIAFSIILLGEVLQLFYFQHLIFDKIPYLVPGEIEMWPVFTFWILSILFIIFGLFTRFAAIINYILTVVVIGTISSFEYDMFYSYIIIGFLFIFLPISNTFSLDRLLLKLKYSNTHYFYNPTQTVSALAYFAPLLLGTSFVYFDSVCFKFCSPLWLNGLGLWLPSSIPQTVFFSIKALLNIKYLVIGLGYLALFFELSFLFVFWRKKLRIPILIIGVGLHIGILVFFPIPFFALGFSAIYLLMVPVKFWEIFFKRKLDAKKLIKFYYDGECPLCIRTVVILNHFNSSNHIEFLTLQHNVANETALKEVEFQKLLDDIYSVDKNGKVYIGFDTYIQVFNAIWYFKPLSWMLRFPGIYHIGKRFYKFIAINRTTQRCTEDSCGYVSQSLPADDRQIRILSNYTLKDIKSNVLFWGIAVLVVLQVIVTYNSPLLIKARDKIGISNTKVIKVSENVAYKIASFSKVFLGITHHGVFLDSHFDGYNHTIAVVYKPSKYSEQWLPIFDPDGTPGNYLFGPIWTKWTFRVNGPLIDQQKLANGIRDFTAFWAYKNHINLKYAIFEIKVKKNKVPTHWEYNFLETQLQNPWLDAGEATWKNYTFYPNIKIIEKM